jgi:mannose-6-phosphate isomerase-like protein (cupin superfamily)
MLKFLPAERGKMRMIFFATIALAALAASPQMVDLYTPQQISLAKQQLARQGSGFASRDLQKYGNHYTMLAYRALTGSSEIHLHEADIFVIEEGDAMIITGGKIIGSHLQKPGELRGTSIEGGEKRPLKTGDIIHIPAGTPHQILVSPGKPITYFVVKVSGQ